MAIAPFGRYLDLCGMTGNFSLLSGFLSLLALGGFVCSTSVKLPKRRRVEGKPKMSLDHFFLPARLSCLRSTSCVSASAGE